MATSGLVSVARFSLLLLGVVSFLGAPQLLQPVHALPAPGAPVVSIDPKTSAQQLPQPLDSKNRTTLVAPIKSALIDSLVPTEHTGSSKSTTITSEKLKRGLSNFMNQLDAAPFFVPVNLHQSAGNNHAKLSHYSAMVEKGNAHELANTIDGLPSTMMKNVNRPLVQIWANGGPGRWGRR